MPRRGVLCELAVTVLEPPSKDGRVVGVEKALRSPSAEAASIAANQPWTLGDALRQVTARRWNSLAAFTPVSSLLASLPAFSGQPAEMFDPEKAYLLVGGIGSLGVHMALWMYEVSDFESL